jgi:ABC-type siderophore export system fused ATPase/permease subunit
MSDELQELQENAEHAHHNPSMAPVSLTMAVLAVCVAVVSLLGHRAHTEEVVLQAKNIREHEDILFTEMAAVVASNDAAAVAKVREKYSQEAEKYKHDKDEIQEQARELDREGAMEMRRADRYDLAEVFLEIGLVVTSITLLSGRRIFWHSGIVLSVVGVAVAVMGALVK